MPAAGVSMRQQPRKVAGANKRRRCHLQCHRANHQLPYMACRQQQTNNDATAPTSNRNSPVWHADNSRPTTSCNRLKFPRATMMATATATAKATATALPCHPPLAMALYRSLYIPCCLVESCMEGRNSTYLKFSCLSRVN